MYIVCFHENAVHARTDVKVIEKIQTLYIFFKYLLYQIKGILNYNCISYFFFFCNCSSVLKRAACFLPVFPFWVSSPRRFKLLLFFKHTVVSPRSLTKRHQCDTMFPLFISRTFMSEIKQFSPIFLSQRK